MTPYLLLKDLIQPVSKILVNQLDARDEVKPEMRIQFLADYPKG